MRHILLRPVFMLCTSIGNCYMQVAGTYPPYVSKSSALSQTKLRKTAPIQQTSDVFTSDTSRAELRIQNSIRSDARFMDAKVPMLTAGGIFRSAEMCEGVPVLPGSTHFSRHKIYYNTKRENKFGLPASHILLQQESASSLSQMSMEVFGGTPELSESFMRNSILVAFLRGLRKRFQRCTVLKFLARGCPIGSNKRRNRKNDGVKLIFGSHRSSSINSALQQHAPHPMETDMPQKPVIFPNTGFEESAHSLNSVADCKASTVPCQAMEGEQVTRDLEIKKEEVIFKKTKRGCRGGKRKLEIRSAFSSSSYKKQKSQDGCAVDSVQQTAPSAPMVEPYIPTATTASKQSANNRYDVTGNSSGHSHDQITASTHCNSLPYGPLSRASTNTTSGPGPYPAPSSTHGPPSYPPQRAEASQKPDKPINAPRTGTVGDRLLARMRSNVFKDITLTRTHQASSTTGPTSADNTSPGGYISQDECVRRSRGVSQFVATHNLAVQSDARGGGGGGGGTNKSGGEMKREAKATKEGLHSDRRISLSSDASGNEFQYWVESSEGSRGKDEGEGDCTKSMVAVSDTAECRLPVRTVTYNDNNPTPDNPCDHSASDNNCTDVTESVSSLLVAEGIRATTARILDSGLALHVTYRTLRTELSQSSSESISAVGSKYWAKLKSSGLKTAAGDRSLPSAQQRTLGQSRTIVSSINTGAHNEFPSPRNVADRKRKILDPVNLMPHCQPPSAHPSLPLDTHNFQGIIADSGQSPPQMRRRTLDLSQDSLAPRTQGDEHPFHSKVPSPESFLSSSSPSQPSILSSSLLPSSQISFCSMPRRSPESNSSLPTPTPPRADPPVSPDMDYRSLCTPIDDVCDFVKAVCRQVFTLETVWGTRHNLSGFLSAVDRYVRLGRGETMTLAQSLLKIRLKDIPWLRSSNRTGAVRATSSHSVSYRHADDASVVSAQHTAEQFHRFYFWVFEMFINPLISSSFYVTEAEGRGSEVHYFRKGVWNRLLKKAKEQMGCHFMRICADQTDPRAGAHLGGKEMTTHGCANKSSSNTTRVNSSSSTVNDTNCNHNTSTLKSNTYSGLRGILDLQGAPTVRFVPKKNSLRPITNLKSRPKAALKAKTASAYASYGMESGVVTNSALYNCLHILKHKYSMRPSLAGFGSFGVDELYFKLRRYRERSRSSSRDVPVCVSSGAYPFAKQPELTTQTAAAAHTDTSTPQPPLKYYVAALDLEKCYDNVDTSLLFDLIVNLLCAEGESVQGCADSRGGPALPADADGGPTGGGRDRGQKDVNHDSGLEDSSEVDDRDDGYLVHRYSVAHYISSMERVVTKPVRFVAGAGDLTPFREASEEIARHYRNSVISDGVVYSKMTNADILKLVRAHLFAHVVRMPFGEKDSSYYTQVRGIPQGSILSPLLCNLYYGEAERQVFGSDKEVKLLGLEGKSLIMRLMDDYLMISTDKAAVQHFLQRAHQALKPFGGGVNPLKTKVNFHSEIEIDGERITLSQLPSSSLHWCGFEVDTVTLEVQPSMVRIFERPLSASVSVECSHPGVALRQTMKSFVRMKCHAIVLDRNLNSYETVLRTVYRSFLVAAMRTHCYLTATKKSRRMAANGSYLSSCIFDAVQFGARLIHSRSRDKKLRVLLLGERSTNARTGERTDRHSLFTRCVSLSVDPPDTACTAPHAARRAHEAQELQGPLPGLSESSSNCDIPYLKAAWLGFEAFHAALKCRSSSYSSTLRFLECKIRRIKVDIARSERTAAVSSLLSSSSSDLSGCGRSLETDEDILKGCNHHLTAATWL